MASGDAAGSVQVNVKVGVSVDGDGNIRGYVNDVVRRETPGIAAQVTGQALKTYDRRLPDRMAQVNRNPRLR